MPNLFRDLPDARAAEITEVLAAGPGARVERITSMGQASADDFWYDQDEDEWVAVLSGWGELQWSDGTVLHLAPGDHVFIPAHTRHRVAGTDPEMATVWLAFLWPSTPSIPAATGATPPPERAGSRPAGDRHQPGHS